MRALPNQIVRSRYSRRLVPTASASAEGQLSDLLDPDQLVSWVPIADIPRTSPDHRGRALANVAQIEPRYGSSPIPDRGPSRPIGRRGVANGPSHRISARLRDLRSRYAPGSRTRNRPPVVSTLTRRSAPRWALQIHSVGDESVRSDRGLAIWVPPKCGRGSNKGCFAGFPYLRTCRLTTRVPTLPRLSAIERLIRDFLWARSRQQRTIR
jgi:hypothetical protein